MKALSRFALKNAQNALKLALSEIDNIEGTTNPDYRKTARQAAQDYSEEAIKCLQKYADKEESE